MVRRNYHKKRGNRGNQSLGFKPENWDLDIRDIFVEYRMQRNVSGPVKLKC